MKKLMILSIGMVMTASVVLAQSETPTTSQTTPAVKTEQNPGAPVAGKNSFTEAQVRERLVKAGYSDVSALAKDGKGVWRGKAMKSGASADVALDYQGNITSQ